MVALDVVAALVGVVFGGMMRLFRLSVKYFAPIFFLLGYLCFALSQSLPVAAGGHPDRRQILPGQSFRNILDRLCLQRSVPPRSLRHQTLPITPSKRIITEYSGLRFRHNDVHLPLIVACCVTSC